MSSRSILTSEGLLWYYVALIEHEILKMMEEL